MLYRKTLLLALGRITFFVCEVTYELSKMERNVGEEMEIGAEISYDMKEKVTKGR